MRALKQRWQTKLNMWADELSRTEMQRTTSGDHCFQNFTASAPMSDTSLLEAEIPKSPETHQQPEVRHTPNSKPALFPARLVPLSFRQFSACFPLPFLTTARTRREEDDNSLVSMFRPAERKKKRMSGRLSRLCRAYILFDGRTYLQIGTAPEEEDKERLARFVLLVGHVYYFVEEQSYKSGTATEEKQGLRRVT